MSTRRAPLFPAYPDPVRKWGRIAPDRVALVDHASGRALTYAELDRLGDSFTAMLAHAGVRRGDRVGIIAANRLEHVVLFLSCVRAGAALVPFNWRLADAELAHVLRDARVRVCFGEDRFRAGTERAFDERAMATRWIDLDHELPALLRRAAPRGAPARLAADDAALVLYTSGSTGVPKGAVIPHRQILWNAMATVMAWELGAEDVAPVATPFFHTGAWNVFATPLWHCGGRVVLLDSFRPDEFLDVLAAERVTVALTVPTQLHMLANATGWGRELPALRAFVSGGAPLPHSLAVRARDAGYRVREGYGLTECGPNCFSGSPDGAPPGCVGWPIDFLEVRVAATDGSAMPDGEPGELLLRGPQLFAGYLGAPSRTAEAFARGGWLRTGDIARRNEDGTLAICGRLKEMFISGGENVFPGEVEAVLAECDGVMEAAVVGVADEKWGEVGRAFVVPHPGATLSPDRVIALARDRLAGYKVPRSVIVLADLPRLASGKVDRATLAREEWQMASE